MESWINIDDGRPYIEFAWLKPIKAFQMTEGEEIKSMQSASASKVKFIRKYRERRHWVYELEL